MSYPVKKILNDGSTYIERPETRILVFETRAACRAYPITDDSAVYRGALAAVLGNTAPFDTTLRLYAWDQTSTAADNGVNVLKPNGIGASDPGRWRSP
jgi:hypothetical protein